MVIAAFEMFAPLELSRISAEALLLKPVGAKPGGTDSEGKLTITASIKGGVAAGVDPPPPPPHAGMMKSKPKNMLISAKEKPYFLRVVLYILFTSRKNKSRSCREIFILRQLGSGVVLPHNVLEKKDSGQAGMTSKI